MSTRRSTRVKAEPLEEGEEQPKEKEAPKRKKKDDQPQGEAEASTSSTSTRRKSTRAVRSEVSLDSTSPPPETSPSVRKGRKTGGQAAELSSSSSSAPSGLKRGPKPAVPINDALDMKCLAEYRKAKAPKDILSKHKGDALKRFILSALRAAEGVLSCPGCSKAYTSHGGLGYHLERCKEATVEWDSTTASLTYSEVTAHPWMWINGTRKAKEQVAAEALKKEPSGISCVRAGQEDCDADGRSFMSADAFIVHMNTCCVPNYNQFKGRIEEFRQMDKKMRSTLIRLSMTANDGQLPCLCCGKYFFHKYGLAYHLERCGFTDDNVGQIPWKCYRCGFRGLVADRDAHLEICCIPPSEALKPLKDRVEVEESEVIIKRKRMSHLSMAATGNVPSESSQTKITSCGLKRFKFRKSEAMLHSITIGADLDNYRAAVAAAIEQHELQQQLSFPVAEMLNSRAEAAKEPWKRVEEGSYISSLRDKRSIGLRPRQLRHFAQADGSSKINSHPKRTTFPPVVEHPSLPPEAELKRVPTFRSEIIEGGSAPSVSVGYAGGPIAATMLAPNPIDENTECLAVLTFPDDEDLIGATTGESDWHETDAYIQLWRVEKKKERREEKEGCRCDLSLWFVLKIEGSGLAICATWMPRTFCASDTEESEQVGYLAVGMSDGSVLVYCMRKDSVEQTKGEEDEVPVVCPEPLLVLAAPTMEQVASIRRRQRQERRPAQTGEEEMMEGVEGERLTRGARKSMLSTPVKEKGKRGKSGEGGEEGGEGEEMSSPKATDRIVVDGDSKPLMSVIRIGEGGEGETEGETEIESQTEERMEGGEGEEEEGNSQGKNSQSTPVRARSTKAERRKELARMRMVKQEQDEPVVGPPPPPPIIALSWSPFESCSNIAAVDAAGTVIIWELNEDMIKGREEEEEEEEERGRTVVAHSKVIVEINWVSPAISVGWMGKTQLGISFAERLVRVIETTTGHVELEENTVRTAGKSLLSSGICFEGLFIFQSEFYTATEAPETAVVYLSYDLSKEGYFVVPMSNRHGLMVWAVAVSSTGVVATAGADGRLQMSMNGKILPRGCMSDLSVNLHTDPLLLIRNRVTEPVPAVDENAQVVNGKEKKPPPPPVYVSHEDVTSKMWLDVVCEDAETISGPSLPQGLLDARVESLNTVTITPHSSRKREEHVVVTGGQAGLLFARSAAVEEKGVTTASSWLAAAAARLKSSNSSKEGTPRPRSRASKERTPREKRGSTD